MVTVDLAMTTAPRPREYVPRALASLREAGFHETLHLFAEPGCPDWSCLSGVILRSHTRTLGCAPNWKYALSWLVGHSFADWLLLLQDDVVWQPNAGEILRQAMEDPALRDVGLLSAYTSPAMVPREPPSGWQEALFPNPHYWGVKRFWGALAIALPRASAEALVACPRFRQHDHPRKLDELLGDCCRDLGRSCRVHVPSLTDHIGEQSSIGRSGLRFFANQWARRGVGFPSTASSASSPTVASSS